MKKHAPHPRAYLVLLGTALLAPVVIFLAMRAVASNKNEVSDWLPASYDETKQLAWFREFFVADQFVVISWEGCTLGADPDGLDDDPRIEKLTRELRAAKLDLGKGSEPSVAFTDVKSGRDLMRTLTSAPTSLPVDEATARIKGTMIGPDGEQTCVLATLGNSSAELLRKTVGRPVRAPLGLRKEYVSPLFAALERAGIAEDEVRLGGPPIDNVAIDEEGEKTLARLAGLAGLFGIALAYWSLRNVRMTALVLCCGVLSAALALAIVAALGDSMDAIMMSMPALVYVLAVSGAIHYVNYYRQAIISHGIEHAALEALHHAWRPAILCSATTSIGLFSLVLSDITPIRKFGFYSGTGVIAMLAVLFLMLPAFMRFWPWMPNDLTPEPDGNITPPKSFWHGYGEFVHRRHALVFAGCMALIGALCMGLPKVRTSIDLMKLFSSDARLITDYRWFEEKLGRLVPMELVVRFPKSAQQEQLAADAALPDLVESHTFLERFELVSRLEKSIAERLGPKGADLAGATMSAATFSQQLSEAKAGFRAQSERAITEKELSGNRRGFLDSGFLAVDPKSGEELWRISVRFAAFHGIDHGLLDDKLRKVVEPEFTARRAAVDALRKLTAIERAVPSGKRVLVLTPKEPGLVAASLGAQLAGKRVQAAAFNKPLDQVTEAQAETLRGFDGVILAAGDSKETRAAARKLGLRVLAAVDEKQKPRSDGAEVGVVYTGVIPIVYKAQQALLSSLVQSTWWSFATILPLMMFVCRGVGAGMVVMIPNTLPVLVVFGGMGWLGIPVDIGSMMAASIALGVAVDDTIHFLAWFRDDFHRLGDRAAAVMAAFDRSATATLQASLINGLGLAVFATSSFTPTQRFGWLMLTILFAGLAAELIMLPAILFGPLGSVFKPPESSPWDDDTTDIDTDAETGAVAGSTAEAAASFVAKPPKPHVGVSGASMKR
ncbi:MAG: efflux RND transporter permease subunit [Lacipirellulaceae bacterium]